MNVGFMYSYFKTLVYIYIYIYIKYNYSFTQLFFQAKLITESIQSKNFEHKAKQGKDNGYGGRKKLQKKQNGGNIAQVKPEQTKVTNKIKSFGVQPQASDD